jgi:hypothetical protein
MRFVILGLPENIGRDGLAAGCGEIVGDNRGLAPGG